MHIHRENRIIAWTAALVLVMVVVLGNVACDSEMAKEFRAASRTQLESGVDAMVDGLLDGVFTLWDPESSSSSSSSSSSESS